MARQADVCESGLESVISVPLGVNGLQVVSRRGNFAYICIEVNAGTYARLVHKVEKDDHVLHRFGDDSSVIRVPLADEL